MLIVRPQRRFFCTPFVTKVNSDVSVLTAAVLRYHSRRLPVLLCNLLRDIEATQMPGCFLYFVFVFRTCCRFPFNCCEINPRLISSRVCRQHEGAELKGYTRRGGVQMHRVPVCTPNRTFLVLCKRNRGGHECTLVVFLIFSLTTHGQRCPPVQWGEQTSRALHVPKAIPGKIGNLLWIKHTCVFVSFLFCCFLCLLDVFFSCVGR